jgi:transposase-like protein
MEDKTKLESALDELLTGKTTEEIVGPKGLLKQLTKALIERAMNAELNHHLGYQKHAPEGRGTGNSRNGRSRKKVQGDFGSVEIEVPRDRNGTYDPKIIPKHERRFTGFDQKILSMYAVDNGEPQAVLANDLGRRSGSRSRGIGVVPEPK